jgi:hypothetical protein
MKSDWYVPAFISAETSCSYQKTALPEKWKFAEAQGGGTFPVTPLEHATSRRRGLRCSRVGIWHGPFGT